MTNLRAFRRSMTPARKRRIHERENGLCGRCKEPVPMFGPEVEYDHYSQIAISCDDTDENVFPLHVDCHKAKTASDAKARAKVERQRLKFIGEFPASPTPLKSGNSFKKRFAQW